MRDTFILSLAIIVLSVTFIATTQQIKQNQNNIISRIESLEQDSGEDPGEDPGEIPSIKNYVKVIELQPGETLELTEDMYFIDVEFMRDANGGIYSDPVNGPTGERIDVFEGSYNEEDDNSYKFRYYIGKGYYFYNFTFNDGGYVTIPEIYYIRGVSLPFITLSENNTNPASVIIYYL